jgi:hypothetical protein
MRSETEAPSFRPEIILTLRLGRQQLGLMFGNERVG